MVSPSLIASPAYANPLCAIATVGIFSAIVIWQTDKIRSELKGDIKDFERRLTNCIQGVEARLEGMLESVEARLDGMLESVEEMLTDYTQLVAGNIQGDDLRLRTGAQRFHETIAIGGGTIVGVGGQAQVMNQGIGNVSESVASESGDFASNEAPPNSQND